ncbi:MAG: PKD domain-containing protein [Bacteroidota bacterium]
MKKLIILLLMLSTTFFTSYAQPGCEDCFNFNGIEVIDVNGCDLGLVMDYAGGECGPISIVSETWDFGDGTTGSGLFVNHTYPSNGTYTVTATVVYQVQSTGQICTAVFTTTVNVTDCGSGCDDCINLLGIEILSIDQCTADFVADYNFNDCGPITVLNHAWDFGDGTVLNGSANEQHTYSSNGTYTVTVTVTYQTGSGEVCTATISTTVTITDCSSCDDCINLFGIEILSIDQCMADFVANYNFNDCGPVTVLNHAWDFGDGTTLNGGVNEKHTYSANGTYTVTVTVTYQTGSGEICTATISTTVTITDCSGCDDCINLFGIEILSIDQCMADFVANYNFNDCGPITILNHAWDFGDGTTLNGGVNEKHTYASDGTYTVTVTITYQTGSGEICTATMTTVVEITDCGLNCDDCINLQGLEIVGIEQCKATFVLDYNFLDCGPITPISYVWDFGDGTVVSGGFSETHSYASNGSYTVTVTFTFKLANGQVCTITASTIVLITECEGECSVTAPTNLGCQFFISQLQLTWDPVPGATCYIVSFEPASTPPAALCCRRGTLFFPIAVNTTTNVVNVPANLPACFKWRVRACCEDGFSPWSAYRCQSNTVLCPIVAKPGPGGTPAQADGTTNLNTVKVFPNPSSDAFNIALNFEKAQNINIRILDGTGKLIYALDQQEISAGESTQEWAPAMNLPNGMYFLEISTEDQILREKLILQR